MTLIKQYVQFIDMDNGQNPFIVQNAPSYTQYDLDIADPTDQELAAPGLIVRPYLDSEEAKQRFWNSFSSNYRDQDLPSDVIAAIRGEESPWKLIRCAPELSAGGSRLFLLLANPAIFSATRDHINIDELCAGVEQDVKNGVIWANLEDEAIGNCEIDILQYQGDNYDRCTVRLRSCHFDFIEYKTDGRIKRHNSVNLPDAYCAEGDNILYRNDVTEYI